MSTARTWIIGNIAALAIGISIGLYHGAPIGLAVAYVVALLVDIRYYVGQKKGGE